jgi:thiamine-monophosphate kinase
MARRRKKVRPVQERAFHTWLAAHLPAGHEGLLPLGDDAAAVEPPAGQVAVLSTDALVEGTHFLPDSPPGRIGSAASAVTLSDLAAKGARPAAILLALVVPVGTSASWVARVARGAEQMAARHGAHLVGGDTKPGPVPTVVSCGLGWGRADRLAPRSQARAGDLLVHTGTVGRGGVAAARLGGARAHPARALAELLDVHPRVDEGIALARFAHAMLDTSDGLAEAARLLAEASGVRIVVEEDRLPLAPAVRALGSSVAARRAIAFYGGDYELLAAIPPAALARAIASVRSAGGRLRAIGRVETGRGAWLSQGATIEPMPLPGWRPFETAVPRRPFGRTV